MGKRSSDKKISVIFYLKAVLVVIIKYIILNRNSPFSGGWLAWSNHSDTETRNHVLIYLCWLVSKYILYIFVGWFLSISYPQKMPILFSSGAGATKRVKLKQWLNDGGETELNSPAFLQIYKI